MKIHKQTKNIGQSNKDDLVKDGLVKDDLVKDSLIEDYLRYTDYLERKEWTRERVTITELLSSLATINKLRVGESGIVLDVRCPAGLIVSIPGTEGLPYGYDIEGIRPIEIKFANSDGNEICPDTCIKILKHRLLKKEVQIQQVLYRDISMTNYSDSPHLFKDYKDLYRFKKGIEIKGEDSIRLHVINPDVNIDDVKFNLGIDLWTRFSET